MTTSTVLVTAPSPLAGEGSAVLPHAIMGEGFVCRNNPPHPFEFVGQPLRPLPQGGEGTRGERRAFWPNEATQRRGENNQPAAAGNNCRLGVPVSGLLF